VDLVGVVLLDDERLALADDALPADGDDRLHVRRVQLEGGLDRAGLLDVAAAPVLGQQPPRIVVDVAEVGRIDRLQAVQRLEDCRLAGLVLADQAGHVWLDADRSGVDDVAKASDPDAGQLHWVDSLQRRTWILDRTAFWTTLVINPAPPPLITPLRAGRVP
jgi:hypothetical protein